MTPHQRRVQRIEAAAADAMVCRVRAFDDGWRLRFNDGVTRRCNAVLAEHAGLDLLAAKIERAEAFYRDHGTAARFQLTTASQPVGLGRALAERGYRSRPGALVQTADLAHVASRPDAAAPFGVIGLEVAPSRRWLEALGRGSGEPESSLQVRAANLEAVPARKAFVEVASDGGVAAVGFAALSGEWIGVFNMATVPQFRRRGAARRVLQALAAWGLAQGAGQAYLQVHPENVGAQALYASLGFATHHGYDYWEAPP